MVKIEETLDNLLFENLKSEKMRDISFELISLARKKYPKIPESEWFLAVTAWADNDFAIDLIHNGDLGEKIELIARKNSIKEVISLQKEKIIKGENISKCWSMKPKKRSKLKKK